MFEKRPKLSFFILGMFFGALCGGILVYYNSVITNENKISVNLIPQIVKQVIGVINTKNVDAKDSTNITLNNLKQVSSETNKEQKNENISDDDLSNNEFESEENVIADSINTTNFEEPITIKKEELLVSKEIMIQFIDNNTTAKTNKNDSLLAVVSGTKDESKKGAQQKMLVELWKSPINYKGYQASKNKLVCFGLTEIDEIKLFSFKNNLILKYYESVYTIELNSDFNNYEKLTDSNTLNLINKLNP